MLHDHYKQIKQHWPVAEGLLEEIRQGFKAHDMTRGLRESTGNGFLMFFGHLSNGVLGDALSFFWAPLKIVFWGMRKITVVKCLNTALGDGFCSAKSDILNDLVLHSYPKSP